MEGATIIPSWVLEVGFGSIVTVSLLVISGIISHVFTLMERNRQEDKEAILKLELETKAIRDELHSRVSNSEEKLLDAISKLPTAMISEEKCAGRQDLWNNIVENLMDVNKKEHDSLFKSIRKLADNVKAMSDDVNELNDVIMTLSKCVEDLIEGKEDCR